MTETVLIVDDDELVLESLGLEASEAGYMVACAGSGAEALRLARLNPFNAVVCDIRMPGMNGLELLEHLKRLQPYIRTMVITGYASPDTPVRALKMRVDDYLLKPFDGPTFLSSLRQILDLNRTGKEDRRRGPAHQDALLGILRQTLDGRSQRGEMAEYVAIRANSLGFGPRQVRLVYLCALLYDVDLSLLAPFSGLQAVARVLREAKESVPDRQREARVLAEAVDGYRCGEREGLFTLPEADWIGMENQIRLAAKQKSMGHWNQADALYKKILDREDLEADLAVEIRLEQFTLGLDRGEPDVLLGRRVVEQASHFGLDRVGALATLHLARVESVGAEALEGARKIFESWNDGAEAAACEILLDKGAHDSSNDSDMRQRALLLIPEIAGEQRADESCLVQLFGPLRVMFQGRVMPDSDWVSRKDRLLFAYLCAHSGRVLMEESLLELLWSRGGDRARHSLHNSVSQIRRVLSKLTGLGGKGLLERIGDGYRLNSSIEVDLAQFWDALDRGRRDSLSGDSDSALSHLQKAENLARREFMEGDYVEWTFPLREELRARKVELLSLLARYFRQHGKEDRAYRYWRRVLELDNCREEAYQALIRFLRSRGRESEAFKLYQAAERCFEEELGLSVPTNVVVAYQGDAI